MIKAAPIPFPFALFLLAPRILAQNQPTSTKRGKTDWYQAETFPFRVPLFPQSTLPLSFLETRIQHGYKQRLLIEPPAVPATSLSSRKDGIADPDHFEIKRLNSTRKRGLCTWPVIEPAHNGRCSLPRTGFKGSFAVDIDRENGETVFPCISFCSIERERRSEIFVIIICIRDRFIARGCYRFWTIVRGLYGGEEGGMNTEMRY